MSEFKVGDRVVYITKNRYKGMIGTIISIESKRYKVKYDCETTKGIFSGSFTNWENDIKIRHLTKLEKALG